MYSAKADGRNIFRFFTEEMNAQLVEVLTMEQDLRGAIERDELFLVYQPLLEMATGKVVALEALLRWRHPAKGLIPPGRFIPVAEGSGLILPIGEWVLRKACSVAKMWQEQGLPPFPVAVNVSAVQFRQDGFCDLVGKTLDETGLASQYLDLELTESSLLSSTDLTFPLLRRLTAMGVKLTIDDFGTGYSSLSYLRQFPVHKIKIDRSFIHDVVVNSDSDAIVTAIISMAKGLNLKVVAEGVETDAQMSFLQTRDCDEIQGYYFCEPLVAREVVDKILRAQTPLSMGANAGR